MSSVTIYKSRHFYQEITKVKQGRLAKLYVIGTDGRWVMATTFISDKNKSQARQK
jgi:hypothetical protein